MRLHESVGIAGLLIGVLAGTADAKWVRGGTSVASNPGYGSSPVICSDGAGGAIVVFREYNGGPSNLFAQRIDPDGNALWAAGGVPVCTAPGWEYLESIIPDGAGGAIVAWSDARTDAGDIYAQRIAGNGTVLWAPNGVALCSLAGNQGAAQVVSDSFGGAIVVWQDWEAGVVVGVLAQRVSASGAPQWIANGVPVCSALTQYRYGLDAVSDGAGNVLVIWTEDRFTGSYRTFAQKVMANGSAVWTAAGIPVSVNGSDYGTAAMAADDAGGAYIAWGNGVSGSITLYAQRVSSGGALLWGASVPVSWAAAGVRGYPAVASTGDGVVIAWDDTRNGPWNAYAQRLTSAGAPLWLYHGIPLAPAGSTTSGGTIVSPASDGTVTIAWHDYRSGSSDIYAQRLTADGANLWTDYGVPVTDAPGYQWEAKLTAGTNGNLLFAWTDERAGFQDIYAQRIEPVHGAWGRPEPSIEAVFDVPADQGGKVLLAWDASGHDAAPGATVTHYSIWRAVYSEPGAATVSRRRPTIVDPVTIPADFAGAAAMPGGGDVYYWEWIANQSAFRLPAYSFTAPTLNDSTPMGIGDGNHLMVMAHSEESYVFPSNVGFGYSVDNLSPPPPGPLAALRTAGDVQLTWRPSHPPDLRDYAVYRSTSPGVPLDAAHFIGASSETTFNDVAAPGGELHYVVTAFDVHSNESAASNEALATGPGSGVPDLEASLLSLALRPCAPNPFAGRTTLRFGLPVPEDVTVEIVDVAGRRVSSSRLGRLPAGWHSFGIDAADANRRPLANGVYFVRVGAGAGQQTTRMIVKR